MGVLKRFDCIHAILKSVHMKTKKIVKYQGVDWVLDATRMRHGTAYAQLFPAKNPRLGTPVIVPLSLIETAEKIEAPKPQKQKPKNKDRRAPDLSKSIEV